MIALFTSDSALSRNDTKRYKPIYTDLGTRALVDHGREHRPHVAEEARGVDDQQLAHHLGKQELVHLRPHLEQPHKLLRHLG